MRTTLSPIVSEFETLEQETRYTAWLRQKVDQSLADQSPGHSHDDVMAEAEAIIIEATQSPRHEV